MSDYHFHKVTVDGEVRVLMPANGGSDLDTLVDIERWERSAPGPTCRPAAMAALPDNVDMPLADFLVELVGVTGPG